MRASRSYATASARLEIAGEARRLGVSLAQKGGQRTVGGKGTADSPSSSSPGCFGSRRTTGWSALLRMARNGGSRCWMGASRARWARVRLWTGGSAAGVELLDGASGDHCRREIGSGHRERAVRRGATERAEERSKDTHAQPVRVVLEHDERLPGAASAGPDVGVVDRGSRAAEPPLALVSRHGVERLEQARGEVRVREHCGQGRSQDGRGVSCARESKRGGSGTDGRRSPRRRPTWRVHSGREARACQRRRRDPGRGSGATDQCSKPGGGGLFQRRR